MTQLLTGVELHDSLIKAGIIPETSGDVIIYVPCSGIVTIHAVMAVDERILKCFPAKIEPAQIRQVDPEPK